MRRVILLSMFYILILNLKTLQAAPPTDSNLKALKNKKFCLFQVGVDYNGTNDVLTSEAHCDGDDTITFESKKIENDKVIDEFLPKFISSYGKKFLEEGFKPAGCMLATPPGNVRYYTRYSCTFLKANS